MSLNARVHRACQAGLETLLMSHQHPLGQSPLAMFRPVLWLAAVAFALGFGGYLLLGLHAALD